MRPRSHASGWAGARCCRMNARVGSTAFIACPGAHRPGASAKGRLTRLDLCSLPRGEIPRALHRTRSPSGSRGRRRGPRSLRTGSETMLTRRMLLHVDLGAWSQRRAVPHRGQRAGGRRRTAGAQCVRPALGALRRRRGVRPGHAGPGHRKHEDGVPAEQPVTQLPCDYLHPNHAGDNAMGEVVDIWPFAPRRHHHRNRSRTDQGLAGSAA